MGKIKIRTKGKGKRWIKGHSCVSNPQNNKHRDEAKARLFYDTFGKHNMIIKVKMKLHER
jgi:hypothetical protein